MKLSVDGGERWELLLTAQQLFRSPLSCYNVVQRRGQSRLEQDRLRNHIDFFQIDVKMLLLNIQQDLDLPNALFENCCGAVDGLLGSFDELLSDGIFTSHGSNGISSIHTQNTDIKLAQTTTLSQTKEIQTGRFFRWPESFVPSFSLPFTSDPQSEHSKIPITSSTKKPQDGRFAKLRFLNNVLIESEGNNRNLDKNSFIRDLIDEDFIKMLLSIATFNQAMKKIFAEKSESFQPNPATKWDSQEDKDKTTNEPDYFARELMQSLHSTLTNSVGRCAPGHRARFNLPITNDSKLQDSTMEIKIYFSLCTTRFDHWHGTMCCIQSGDDHAPKRKREVRNFCDTLHRSQGHGFPLRLLSNGLHIWDLSNPREKSRDGNSYPSISLRSLLDDGYFRHSSKEHGSKISLKEKRALAVVLAHNMLQLCGGPWVPESWNADNIFFLFNPMTQKLVNIRKPFINARLDKKDSPVFELDDRIHRYPLILDFARLLLEIQYGETIQPTEADYHAMTKEETSDTPFFMINRVFEEISDDIFQDYRAAIEACLECEKFLPSEDISFEDLEFRCLIYKNVVMPLENELHKGFKLKITEIITDQTMKGDQPQHSSTIHIHRYLDTGTIEEDTSIHSEVMGMSHIKEYKYQEFIAANLDRQETIEETKIYSRSTTSQVSSRVYSSESYSVAIICPMGVELVPILAILDLEHQPLSLLGRRNKYTLGQIGSHNVVVTVMPEIGNNAAAAVVTQLQNDFKALRFGLLVGIGGGVPDLDKHDIRLGDVVVSKPTLAFGGVVQFDRGKVNTDNHFERTGSLNKPPPVLMASLEDLIARHKLHGNKLTESLLEMVQKYPRLAEEQYVYQGEENDILFQHSYSHQSGNTCLGCAKDMVVPRLQRESKSPKIHYGTIGSSNIVVKDAETRERLKKELGIICVDMEAAGLINEFPCLVIRGICDYADSHKAKRWQPYAAATAAAFAKELLAVVPG
ncbi:hypothetical protein H072_456 [Dactylellina haptotyla CBS 200.50]|uniref:Uncharacterized protein n=1 Tax=Dactylellina haptotyla (strain CBS 200.50) TaxID=1284197 RepID=S8AX47_DACHA|nr:hypothetical protein H072_456 [Dactylellina haptotyla CBS 200.50]